MYAIFAIAVVAAYLLGSVPFAFLIAWAHGKDLRTIGSGNIGATNLARAVGRKWGYFCFALDAGKGFVPMLTATRLIYTTPDNWRLILTLAVGCAAVLGHVFPVYLKFKGGKGVATGFGVAIGFWPYFTICAAAALAVWVVMAFKWRYISLASIIASVFFPVTLVLAIAINPTWCFSELWPLLITAAAIPTIVIIRHKENIKRLLAGTESKI